MSEADEIARLQIRRHLSRQWLAFDRKSKSFWGSPSKRAAHARVAKAIWTEIENLDKAGKRA